MGSLGIPLRICALLACIVCLLLSVGCGDDDDDYENLCDLRTDDDDSVEDDDRDDDDAVEDDDDDNVCNGCLIDEVCHPDRVNNPENPCQICNVDLSKIEWTDQTGTACDDGLFCNGLDWCGNGMCEEHDGDPCTDDGQFCNGQESCNEEARECDHSGNPCTAPDICDETNGFCSDACPGCLIESVCYGDEQINPANVCEICDVAVNEYAWTANDGKDCDDHVFCNGEDECLAGKCDVHAGDPCMDDGLYCNGEEYCNLTDDACDVKNVPICPDDGLYCNGDEICDDGLDDCASTGNPCDLFAYLCNETDDGCDWSYFEPVPAGAFSMGSPIDEPGHEDDEDLHTVTLTRDFQMMAWEVWQGLFLDLIGWNPSMSTGCTLDCPVEDVTWFDTLAFANVLSESQYLAPCYKFSDVQCKSGFMAQDDYMTCMNSSRQGIYAATVEVMGGGTVYDCEGFRLPTEAEWEYGARAGTSTAVYSGDISETTCVSDANLDPIAWHCGNDNSKPEPVGLKLPNQWNLFDMSGNVYEWVWDWYDDYPGDETDPVGPTSGAAKPIRGGAWNQKPQFCRLANRGGRAPRMDESYLGFRLVRTLP